MANALLCKANCSMEMIDNVKKQLSLLADNLTIMDIVRYKIGYEQGNQIVNVSLVNSSGTELVITWRNTDLF